VEGKKYGSNGSLFCWGRVEKKKRSSRKEAAPPLSSNPKCISFVSGYKARKGRMERGYRGDITSVPGFKEGVRESSPSIFQQNSRRRRRKN